MDTAPADGHSDAQLFGRAVVMNLTNPKVLLFFLDNLNRLCGLVFAGLALRLLSSSR